MSSVHLVASTWERLAARVRIPMTAVAVGSVVIALLLPVPKWWPWIAVVTAIPATALYFRVGTPHADPVNIAPPVQGRWSAINSPTSHVPSHFVHAWSQTYAIDLVFEPENEPRPPMRWWPLVRRPDAYPGFGQPVTAPVSGEVVRARSFMRDHLSRSSPPALLYLIVESVRELFGPIGILGNHVVIRSDDGPHVLLAHLRRRSLLIERGDRVVQGTKIAECGNSGNSSEPHVHIQAMDRASVWVAAGLPIQFDHLEPPGNGDFLPTT